MVASRRGNVGATGKGERSNVRPVRGNGNGRPAGRPPPWRRPMIRSTIRDTLVLAAFPLSAALGQELPVTRAGPLVVPAAATPTVRRTVPHELLVPVAPAESLRVTAAGTGSVVVLLPGLFGSAFGYRHLLALLPAAGYRAVVIEPLGIGGSPRPRGADYSLTAQAERIAAALAV